jgi:hypothetical protein
MDSFITLGNEEIWGDVVDFGRDAYFTRTFPTDRRL